MANPTTIATTPTSRFHVLQRAMTRFRPEQRPLTDDEINEGRERLVKFFNEVAEDLANVSERSLDELRPNHY